MGRKVKVKDLVTEEFLKIRDHLDQQAVERYAELYRDGSHKSLWVQQGTNRVIDGHHRLAACLLAGVEETWVEDKELDDRELLLCALKINLAHGVPLSRSERNRAIGRLYREFGYTQQQIAERVGLARSTVAEILGAFINVVGTDNFDKGIAADKRLSMQDSDLPSVARLLLQGVSQVEVAAQFDVAQNTISVRWNTFRDKIRDDYCSGMLKQEVAQRHRLDGGLVDAILSTYDPEPIGFSPATGSLWTGFKLDDRFGQRHPGNLPADLVRNLFYYFTRPGQMILDPTAGGGITLDVAADLVNRTVWAYDIDPKRSDISKWDLLSGKPPTPKDPDVIFMDLPYANMKEGEYSTHPNELGNMPSEQFLAALDKVFRYWQRGRIIFVMAQLKMDGKFVDLPLECAKRMEAAGWVIKDRLINQVNRPASENQVSVCV